MSALTIQVRPGLWLLPQPLDILHLPEQLKLGHAVDDFRILVVGKLVNDFTVALREFFLVHASTLGTPTKLGHYFVVTWTRW